MDITTTEIVADLSSCDPERMRFLAFIRNFTWASCHYEISTAPINAGVRSSRSRRVRPGFIIHSLLGTGLKELACPMNPKCSGSCSEPTECAYGRLMEPGTGGVGTPLTGIARAPLGLAIAAGWDFWLPGQPVSFEIVLLGTLSQYADLVSEALHKAFGAGAGAERWSLSVHSRGWQQEPLFAGSQDDGGESRDLAKGRVFLMLPSPLRIVRKKMELNRFDLVSLVRDLSFRVAVWGHHYQSMEWPAPWGFLFEDASRVLVKKSQLEFVRFRRYSGRQHRVIPMGGLLGTLELEGLSSELELLLHAGEICGVGKGASIGLGRIKVEQTFVAQD